MSRIWSGISGTATVRASDSVMGQGGDGSGQDNSPDKFEKGWATRNKNNIREWQDGKQRQDRTGRTGQHGASSDRTEQCRTR